MQCVLGIDPGIAKVGLAVVRRIDGKTQIEQRGVVEFESFTAKVREMIDAYNAEILVVGNGTNSKKTVEKIREDLPGASILVVDERDTSMRARERYWEYTPRRGWRRLLPSTLLVPPVPIDDFAAAILAESVLNVD